MNAVVRWVDGLQFVGTGKSGHGVLIDTDRDVNGFDAAARPGELLLLSLGGCSGMDVVSILNRMQVAFDRFEVGLKAERRAEYPKSFEKIEMIYRIWGEEINATKLEKAIDLSMERYCMVAHTLNSQVQLSHRYEINPDRRTE